MAHIMQKYGNERAVNFGITDCGVFLPEVLQYSLPQFKSADSMRKPGVLRSRKYQVTKTELADTAKPLNIGVINQLQNYPFWYRDESVYRVTENFILFTFIHQ